LKSLEVRIYQMRALPFFSFIAALPVALAFISELKANIVFAVNATTNANGAADRIVRINADGSGATTLWTTATIAASPRGLAYDSTSNRVFWSDSVAFTTSSASATDGSNLQSFAGANGSPSSLAIDSAAGKLYVNENGFTGPPSTRAITQRNLDGSAATPFFLSTVLSGNTWLTINSGFLYFSDNTNILRRALNSPIIDPSEIIVSATGNGVRGIAVLNNDIYWLDNTADTISRRQIVGGTVSTASLGSGSTPQGLAVFGDQLFYAEQGGIASRGINRFNADLTGLTTLVPLLSNEIANGVAAVPEPGSMALIAGALAVVGGIRFRRRILTKRIVV
jgi:hypothetical protein